MRRLGLVACLVAGLLAASAGSAPAMPNVKRYAKACKQRTPVKRPLRKRCAKPRVKVKRRAVAPPAPAAPQPGSPSAPAPPAPAPAPDPGFEPAPLPPSNPFAVQVRSGEFYLQLSKPEVHAGTVRVEFNNSTAEDPHDLHLVRSDGTGANYAFRELQSGEVEAKSLALNAGSWRLFCGLPAHAERGMSANLRVVAG
jgi:hypothetical protein